MKPFGYSYLLEMYGCKPEVCDDVETIYRFLETLVPAIGMTAFSPPMVIHGPRDAEGKELYPDKAGVSGVVFLIESSIVIHTIQPKGFITLDVYSCREFDKNIVFDAARKTFGFQMYEEQFVPRGKAYHKVDENVQA